MKQSVLSPRRLAFLGGVLLVVAISTFLVLHFGHIHRMRNYCFRFVRQGDVVPVAVGVAGDRDRSDIRAILNAEAIAEIGRIAASDDDEKVRDRAVTLLWNLGTEDVVSCLFYVAIMDSSARVRANAIRALFELQPKAADTALQIGRASTDQEFHEYANTILQHEGSAKPEKR